MKNYIFLFLAIACELTGTTFLKKSEGFTKLVPSIIVVVAMSCAFYFLSQAIKTIPVGIAYAIWSAVGIICISIISAIFFKQVPTLPVIIGLTFIVVGVVIVNLYSGGVHN
ncbi:multidrug efflux SMR transporter [Mucilaginibacter pallidiroseus]|uniref:Multidrug efflux SMR transporter n=1 Tax=Mucilaginibacter pallidiroseus TaxID=2599295 RepID=A0A563UJ73_9SPHI|nr:multidrug efflux SMR transporter [Mucilaginibacter pallidiroseus]TWR31417.1 multidrug efflux SMR transporter [Mucilaginibacter pallidiroseus]